MKRLCKLLIKLKINTKEELESLENVEDTTLSNYIHKIKQKKEDFSKCVFICESKRDDDNQQQ